MCEHNTSELYVRQAAVRWGLGIERVVIKHVTIYMSDGHSTAGLPLEQEMEDREVKMLHNRGAER